MVPSEVLVLYMNVPKSNVIGSLGLILISQLLRSACVEIRETEREAPG